MYIGRSVKIDHRLYGHFRLLRLGKHSNPFLQASFNKHGPLAFESKTLLICRRDDLPMYERLLIAGYKSDDAKFGYNMTVAIEDMLAHKPEARAAISAFQKTFQLLHHYEMTDEIKEKIASKLRGRVGCNKGRIWPDEIKAKFGAPKGNKNRFGKTFTPESKAKISAGLKAAYAENPDLSTAQSVRRQGKPSPRKGATHTAESKAKISASKIGCVGPNLGRTFGPEVRARMSESKKGKSPSKETREKLAEATRLSWAKRRLGG